MDGMVSIVTQIPGVFYRRPSPDQEVYATEGQSIKAGDRIGVVEVMKTMIEIKSDSDGVIERFLVENEEFVDAGQEIAVIKIE